MENDIQKKTSITIGRKEFTLVTVMMDHSDLRFYPENPRIHSLVYADNPNPSQEYIQDILCKKEHVRGLRDSIVTNGGLIEPVIVRKVNGENIVLEGNSRLAAYRMLAENEPLKWKQIKCNVFVDDITDSEVFVLLGQLHIIGKTDWSLFEQAGYLYRTKESTGNSVEDIAKMLGLKSGEAKRLYDIYKYMVSVNDTQASHWSYYEVLLKTNAFKKYMQLVPKFEETVVKKIKAEEFQAIELRDKLGAIAKDGSKDSTKIIKSFVEGQVSLNEAYEDFHDTGKDVDVYKVVKNFRTKICDDTTIKQIKKAVADDNTEIPFELKKIKKKIEGILKELGEK